MKISSKYLSKMKQHVNSFEDKNNSKIMSFHVYDGKL